MPYTTCLIPRAYSFGCAALKSSEKEYNPKLLPADSWYMKCQNSAQLVPEPLATLPKLLAAVTSLLSQLAGPERPESGPINQAHKLAVLAAEELVSLLSGVFLALRAHAEDLSPPGLRGWYHSQALTNFTENGWFGVGRSEVWDLHKQFSVRQAETLLQAWFLLASFVRRQRKDRASRTAGTFFGRVESCGDKQRTVQERDGK